METIRVEWDNHGSETVHCAYQLCLIAREEGPVRRARIREGRKGERVKFNSVHNQVVKGQAEGQIWPLLESIIQTQATFKSKLCVYTF